MVSCCGPIIKVAPRGGDKRAQGGKVSLGLGCHVALPLSDSHASEPPSGRGGSGGSFRNVSLPIDNQMESIILLQSRGCEDLRAVYEADGQPQGP